MAAGSKGGEGCLRAEERLHKTASSSGGAASKRLAHFLRPAVGAPDLVSVLLIRPGGMGAQQFTQMGTVSHEVCFFHANDSKHEKWGCLECTSRGQWVRGGEIGGCCGRKTIHLVMLAFTRHAY